jgi:hypothetical protein
LKRKREWAFTIIEPREHAALASVVYNIATKTSKVDQIY